VELFKLGQKIGVPPKIWGNQKFENWRTVLRIKANDFGASGVLQGRDENLGTNFLGSAPSKFPVHKSAWFWTTIDFDR